MYKTLKTYIKKGFINSLLFLTEIENIISRDDSFSVNFHIILQ